MEHTKEKLIDAAIDLITVQGYEDTSVASIVKRANVAQGTFYLYFQSKYDMVLAIAKRILSHINERVSDLDSSHQSIEDFLYEWIAIVYEVTEQNRDLINYVYSKSAEKQRFTLWEDIYTSYYNWLTKHITYYQTANECDREYDPKELAMFLVNTVEQAAEQHFLFQKEVTDVTHSIRFLHRFLVKSLK